MNTVWPLIISTLISANSLGTASSLPLFIKETTLSSAKIKMNYLSIILNNIKFIVLPFLFIWYRLSTI